jgi:hypothetical protein
LSASVQPVALDSPAVTPGAAIQPLENGGARISTGTEPWQHAVGFRLGPRESATGVLALVACRRGEVGVAVLAEDRSTPVSSEGMVSAGETRLFSALVDPAGEPARWQMVRNGAGAGASESDALAVFTGNVPSVDLIEADVALALRDPAATRAGCTVRAWPEEKVAAAGASGVPLRVDVRPLRCGYPRLAPFGAEPWTPLCSIPRKTWSSCSRGSNRIHANGMWLCWRQTRCARTFA